MAHRNRSLWYPLVGFAFMIAGADKLSSATPYRGMFRHLGWSEDDMRLVGTGELLGGALVASGCLRRLGGALLVGTSATVLDAEIRGGDGGLALPRLAVLAAALTALLPRLSR